MSQPPAGLKFNLPVTVTRSWEMGGWRNPWAELQEVFRELLYGSCWTWDLIRDLRKPWMWMSCEIRELWDEKLDTYCGQTGNKGRVILTGSVFWARKGPDLLPPLSQPPPWGWRSPFLARGSCQRSEGEIKKGIYKANTNWDWAAFDGMEGNCKEKKKKKLTWQQDGNNHQPPESPSIPQTLPVVALIFLLCYKKSSLEEFLRMHHDCCSRGIKLLNIFRALWVSLLPSPRSIYVSLQIGTVTPQMEGFLFWILVFFFLGLGKESGLELMAWALLSIPVHLCPPWQGHGQKSLILSFKHPWNQREQFKVISEIQKIKLVLQFYCLRWERVGYSWVEIGIFFILWDQREWDIPGWE